jgi:hypothetical protein
MGALGELHTNLFAIAGGLRSRLVRRRLLGDSG